MSFTLSPQLRAHFDEEVEPTGANSSKTYYVRIDFRNAEYAQNGNQGKTFTIKLDNQGEQSSNIYLKYGVGVYLDSSYARVRIPREWKKLLVVLKKIL